jgi:hypothetical protein
VAGTALPSKTGEQVQNKIIAAAVCGTLAAGAAAACSSGNTSISGHERFAGTSTSLTSDTVRIHAVGVLSDRGTIDLAGTSDMGTFVLKNGDIDVVHSKGLNTVHVDAATCVAETTTIGSYNVTGGTRSYKGAKGHGAFKIVFSGTLPKVNGACANPDSTQPTSGRLVFHADGPVTLR